MRVFATGQIKLQLKLKLKKLEEKSVSRLHPKIITPVTIKFDTPKANGKMVTFYHSQHIDLFGLECQSCHSNESCGKSAIRKNKIASLKTKQLKRNMQFVQTATTQKQTAVVVMPTLLKRDSTIKCHRF